MSLSYFVNQIMRDMSRMLENQMRLTDEIFRNTPPAIYSARRLIDENRDKVIQDRDKFQIKLDVQDFKPEEISIKTINGNVLEIEGKHEEKQDDHGSVTRHFVRKFVLPKGHDLKSVVSKYSPNGVLTVIAPKLPEAIEEAKEKEIPVQHIEGKKE